jgi:hypothetical protein
MTPPPTKIKFAEAKQRYDLTTRLPTWNDRKSVSVYEGDVLLPYCDLDTLGPCVVTGDLEVTGDLLGPDEGVFLVVLGSCRARNLIISGPEVWIEKDLVVENGILADYNHGALTVGGDLVARIVCAEHIVRVHGAIRAITVDLGGLRVETPDFTPTLSHEQATREARQHFVAEAFNEEGSLEGARLGELMMEGSPILRGPME